MVNAYDVKASELVKETAKLLKDRITKPEYINYVKSGANRERAPLDPDFWYVRNASILRQVYLNGPIGVSRLRVRYGSRKEHSVHRRHYTPGGGSIIRDALQALEKIELIKKTKQGRIITPKGKALIDKLSRDISQGGDRHA
jgi:small subunit ribosomal protein S19e